MLWDQLLVLKRVRKKKLGSAGLTWDQLVQRRAAFPLLFPAPCHRISAFSAAGNVVTPPVWKIRAPLTLSTSRCCFCFCRWTLSSPSFLCRVPAVSRHSKSLNDRPCLILCRQTGLDYPQRPRPSPESSHDLVKWDVQVTRLSRFWATAVKFWLKFLFKQKRTCG